MTSCRGDMTLTNQFFMADKQASFITGNQDKNDLLECMSVFTFAKTEECSPTLLLTCKTKKKGGSPRTPRHIKHTGIRNESSHMKEIS